MLMLSNQLIVRISPYTKVFPIVLTSIMKTINIGIYLILHIFHQQFLISSTKDRVDANLVS